MNSPTKTSLISSLSLGIRLLLRYPWWAAGFLASALLQSGSRAGMIWFINKLLAHSSGSGGGHSNSFVTGALLVMGAWMAQSAGSFLSVVCSSQIGYKTEIDFMQKAIRNLMRMSVSFFDRSSHSDLIMSSYYDCKGLRTALLTTARFFILILTILLLVGVALKLDIRLTLISFCAIPVTTLPILLLGKKLLSAAQKGRDEITSLYNVFLDVCRGIRIIKVNGAEPRVLEQSNTIGSNLFHANIRGATLSAGSSTLLQMAGGVGLMFMLIGGGYRIGQGTIGWPVLLALFMAVGAVFSSFVSLVQVYNELKQAIPNIERVFKIINAEPDIREQINPIPLIAAPDRITLKNVSFSYGERNVIENINLEIKKGETIGIAGPSGSGKSTILSLLVRFYDPTEGAILFDGVDIRTLKLDDLTDKFSLVLQEPIVLSGDVHFNIALARPNASEKEVSEAAKAATIDADIKQMEKGYHTFIGPSFRGLSGGQKQRVSIARAVLKDAPILLLDEATSSLDSVAERQVQSAIDTLAAGRTTIIVAHRLSTLRNADRILVLQDGRTVDCAPHQVLVERCPLYKAMWENQMMGKDFSRESEKKCVSAEKDVEILCERRVPDIPVSDQSVF